MAPVCTPFGVCVQQERKCIQLRAWYTHACLQTGSSTLALPEQDGRFAVSLAEAAPVHLLRCIIMLTTLFFTLGSEARLRMHAVSVDWGVKTCLLR